MISFRATMYQYRCLKLNKNPESAESFTTYSLFNPNLLSGDSVYLTYFGSSIISGY